MRHLAAREVRLGSPPIPALEKERLHIARTYDFMYTEPARKSGVGSGWTLLESDGPAEPQVRRVLLGEPPAYQLN